MPHVCFSRLLVAGLATLPLCALALTGCGPAAPAAKVQASTPEPRDVEVGPVRQMEIERTIPVTGTMFGDEDAIISAKMSGRVMSVARDVGDIVKPGEILAQIERRDYELAIEEKASMVTASLAKIGLTSLPDESFDPSNLPTIVKARAEAANADAKYQRARQLFEQTSPLLSEQDFADIRTAWEVSRNEADVEVLTVRATLAEARAQQSAVVVAQQRLDDTSVIAPMPDNRPDLRYRVSERAASVGEYVSQGARLYRLVATDLIKYRARVPERFTSVVQLDQTARVWTEAAESVVGTVARISPSVDADSRTFVVEIHLQNPAGKLKPGAFGRGEIVFGKEQAMFVPESAVVTFAGVTRVFSVKDGKAVEHRVRVGAKQDDLIEIIGEKLPEQVIVTGAPGLAVGVPVRVK